MNDTKPRHKGTHRAAAKASPPASRDTTVTPEEAAEKQLPLPQVPAMTKTEAYALVKRAREGLRNADNLIWKGTAPEVREALLETITCSTHLLDAVNHQGIKGVE